MKICCIPIMAVFAMQISYAQVAPVKDMPNKKEVYLLIFKKS
jgi:hypothetical protein